MSRIILFGNGWIGSQLASLFQNEIYISHTRADDITLLEKELDDLRPTHVISCIGRTHGMIDGTEIGTIDYLEYPGKLVDNIRDNLYAPVLLAKLCQERGIHYTYLGTGCIFEYDEKHEDIGFIEQDKPNFFGSSYSIVKGFTDQMMKWYDVLNVRIRMPITAQPNPRDFITKIANYQKICSMPNSMTVLDELLPLLADMIIKKRTGTIHLTNPGIISHQEILEMYKEIIDPNKTWETMTYQQQSELLRSKRSNNYLDTTLLQQWYPMVSDIHTAMRRTLEKRKELIESLFL